MNEGNLLRAIMLAITKSVKNCRVFRNNNGQGWQGRCIKLGNKIIVHEPRPLQAGLCPGSSDLIGWTTVKITPDLVGLDIAVFTAVEVKTPDGRLSDEQKQFIKVVRESGGFAHVTRSEEQAVDFLTRPTINQLSIE